MVTGTQSLNIGYDQSWPVDFMCGVLTCARRFRTFNVVDDFNREALSIEIDLNLPALRVVRVLDRIAVNRGYPVMLRMDNGPEFISLAGRYTRIIQPPGKPMQNVFIGIVPVNCKRLVRTVLIFTESSDQLSRATDRVPGLPASPGYVQ